MNGWKPCAGCGDPTLLSLYCDACFRENFKKPVRPGVSPIQTDFKVDMTRIKALEKLIEEHKKAWKK